MRNREQRSWADRGGKEVEDERLAEDLTQGGELRHRGHLILHRVAEGEIAHATVELGLALEDGS